MLTIFDLLAQTSKIDDTKESLYSTVSMKNQHINPSNQPYISEDDFFNRSSSVDYFRTESTYSNARNTEYDNFMNRFETPGKSIPKLSSKFNFSPKDFEIISCLGHGAYAEVYKAMHKPTKEIYSIKIIDQRMIEKENKGYQIFVENEMWNYCNHPNIVKIYGIYEDKDNFYIVEEYCNKGDLAQFWSNNPNLSKIEAQLIIAQIILCWEYLSSWYIIHRDIKPENFMWDNNFQLKLIDFGTSTFKGKILDEETYQYIDEDWFQKQINKTSSTCNNDTGGVFFNFRVNNSNIGFKREADDIIIDDALNDSRTTMANVKSKNIFKHMVDTTPFNAQSKNVNAKILEMIKKQKFVGTAEYMAPEVINNNSIGEYTDIWSLACIIFWIFTSQSPFKDKTEGIPEDAKDLIMSLMKINPTERWGYDVLTNGYNFNVWKEHPFFKVDNPEIDLHKVIKGWIERTWENKGQNIKTVDSKKSNSSLFDWTNAEGSMNTSWNTSMKSCSIWSDLQGTVLKSGMLKKQSPYFYYDLRKVIWFDTPRIDYIEPETKSVKGTIQLNKMCKAELVKNHQFLLKTPNRTYSFMCKEKYDITPWVKAINDAIRTYTNENTE